MTNLRLCKTIAPRHGMLRNAASYYRPFSRRRAGQLIFEPLAQFSTYREPNKHIEIDPALLPDSDQPLKARRFKRQKLNLEGRTAHRELEILSTTVVSDIDNEALPFETEEEDGVFPRSERKSPAASFGSRQIGTIILPYEMQKSVLALMSESEKPLVHADAERLFNVSKGIETKNDKTPLSWSLHYTPLRNTEARSSSKVSHIKARLNRVRDGTAFASVVMPAQYSVIRAVLEQTKARLGDEWAQRVDSIVEWGSGTGAGIWAAHHTFRKNREVSLVDAASENSRQTQGDLPQEELTVPIDNIPRNFSLQHSSLKSYTAIENRIGLSNIARKLLGGIPTSSSISIQNGLTDELLSRPYTAECNKERIAISAFLLTTIQTTSSKKAMLREMWNSGADLMILIEDASVEGFREITDARDFLLRLGNKQREQNESDEVDSTSQGNDNTSVGAHVVAPCPHDKPCPLAFHQKISPSKQAFESTASLAGMPRCTFVQRLQRPSFVRLTKHDKRGEEDTRYSYVVIRRGDRVRLPFGEGQLGREGAVARRAEDAKKAKENGNVIDAVEEHLAQETQEPRDAQVKEEVALVDGIIKKDITPIPESDNPSLRHEDLEVALREESYSWPRINFSPLKRNGHIIIDACMPEGTIMRMTFPRSQGKQIYYDARKCSWGDIFPHVPKHKPVPRFMGRPAKKKTSRKGELDGESAEERELAKLLTPSDDEEGHGRVKGIRKADNSSHDAARAGWSGVMGQLKKEERRRRQERRSARNLKEVEVE